MNVSEPTAPTVLEQVKGVRSQHGEVKAGVLQCLVVSASQTRRNMLNDAASSVGWNTVVCADPRNALTAFQRTPLQFAVIDLDHHGQTPEGFRDLVQTLAKDSSRILVGVCGHEADPAEEVWVRQFGIWLYLPGATNSMEISLLCEQALLIVEKQRVMENSQMA